MHGTQTRIMKKIFYSITMFVAAWLISCSPSMHATSDPNNMEGWHFHICSNETDASRIWFEVSGTTENAKYEAREVKWHSGQDTFIGLPAEVRSIEDINLSIKTSGRKKAKICILYGEYVVKSIEVTGTETNKLNRNTNRDNCPC